MHALTRRIESGRASRLRWRCCCCMLLPSSSSSSSSVPLLTASWTSQRRHDGSRADERAPNHTSSSSRFVWTSRTRRDTSRAGERRFRRRAGLAYGPPAIAFDARPHVDGTHRKRASRVTSASTLPRRRHRRTPHSRRCEPRPRRYGSRGTVGHPSSHARVLDVRTQARAYAHEMRGGVGDVGEGGRRVGSSSSSSKLAWKMDEGGRRGPG
ncbi:hypothetical protein SCHPADRAFT_746161 [Schizopora paradoxa]|uniref:Uncharacterized protein n=1 Tax=Schizopora paradoxa TaxID=27342 RepID=A0A0H2QZC0_9AGAM|nr:hypothetical protein SCHPADRAFT_746161 [Schizopora paradoxa]